MASAFILANIIFVKSPKIIVWVGNVATDVTNVFHYFCKLDIEGLTKRHNTKSRHRTICV